MKKVFFSFLILIIIFSFPCFSLGTSTTLNLNVDSSNLELHSDCLLLIEKNTGDILYEKNAYEKMYPASTTKILTAIIVLEKCPLNERVTISSSSLASIPSDYVVSGLKAR